MTMKKLLSSLICTSIILSNTAFIHAEPITQETDHWNASLVDEVAKDVYEDFPFVIDKTLGRDMNLSISMQYLKNIDADDEVTVSVFDNTEKALVGEYELSENDTFVVLEGVDNDKTYLVSVSENLDSSQKEYIGKIDTKFVPAAFPVDLTLGNIEYNNNNGETFNHVAIKKVGDNPTCNHAEDEECTENCSMASVIDRIEPQDLDTFYSDLDANEFYEIQVEAGSDIMPSDIYRGFISTYAGGDEMGVFTPGYSFEVIEDMNQLQSETASVGLGEEYSIQGLADPSTYDFSTAFEYTVYENEYGSINSGSDEVIVKWTVPQTADYCIETIGNLDLQYWWFTANDDGSVTTTGSRVMSGGTGSNPSASYTLLYGQTIYYVIKVQSGSGGDFAFRIKWLDANNTDGISSYRDEVQAAYDAGNFSPITNECYVDYHGDVNYFVYNVSAGVGQLRFMNIDVNLSAKVLSKYGRTNNVDNVWEEENYTIDGDDDIAHTFTQGIHYIRVAELAPPSANDNNYYDESFFGVYDFTFADPLMKDSLEVSANATFGDVPLYPISVTVPYYNDTRTIHKNDTDTYTFTTDSTGGKAIITLVDPVTCDEYDLNLYESVTINSATSSSVSWSFPASLGTITESMKYGRYSKTLVYDNLLPNHTYYVVVDAVDSDKYSSLHDYIIDIDVEEAAPNPTAVLSGDVALTYTAGETLADLSGFLNSVMEKLTCTLYGETVADDVAVSDVELYIGETQLTKDYVQTLTAGSSHTVTVKYNGQTATGGTVTLTVNAAAVTEDVVQITDFYKTTVTANFLDWTAVAQIIANTRLQKEGSAINTTNPANVAVAIINATDTDEDVSYSVRGTIEQVVMAANYYYTNGQNMNSLNFINETIQGTSAETTLYNAVQQGQVVIMQLSSISDPTNVGLMRYIILCGVNRTTSKYIVFDPIKSLTNGDDGCFEVSINEIHNGGYDGNSDLKFTGRVIQFL